jgi:hypothetical protein
MEGNAMSIQGPFKIDCGEQFPHGLFAIAVGGQLDFEKSQAKLEDAQARDKESGERVWVVRVIDNDPEARQNEFKVKIIAPHCPALPEVVPGTNFRPVVFRNMTVTPYVEESKSGRARVAYSLRATGVEAPGESRKPPASPRTVSGRVGDSGPVGTRGIGGSGMRSADECRLGATEPLGAEVSRAKVQLHEIRDLLGEARRLITEGGSESERAAYLQLKGDLFDRLAEDGHGVRGGEPS